MSYLLKKEKIQLKKILEQFIENPQSQFFIWKNRLEKPISEKTSILRIVNSVLDDYI